MAALQRHVAVGGRSRTCGAANGIRRTNLGGAVAPRRRRKIEGDNSVGSSRGRLQVTAARVAGAEIPSKKRVETALTYIYGIGPTSANKILEATGVENKRVFELEDTELAAIRAEVEKYTVEGDLRRQTQLNIKRLIDIQCYRGKRHQNRLPVRGQRTKTNARTRKGKSVPVAGKKK